MLLPLGPREGAGPTVLLLLRSVEQVRRAGAGCSARIAARSAPQTHPSCAVRGAERIGCLWTVETTQ